MKYFSLTASLLILGLVLINSCNKKSPFYSDGDAFVDEVKDQVVGITPEEAKAMMDTASFYMIIDVREGNEHDPGYIPGSVNIPRGVIEFNVPDSTFWDSKSLYPPLKEDLIFVYCKKGKRSVLASYTLQQMGFTNVKYLIGGFKEWELTYPNDYERNEVESGHKEAEEVGGC